MRRIIISLKAPLAFILMLSIIFALIFQSIPAMAYEMRARADHAANQSLSDQSLSADMEVIEISTVDDFISFANNCALDSYSIGKRFVLTRDILLGYAPFETVPYFNGQFEGNGHVISFSSISAKGSNYGLFRYVGHMGSVTNLSVSGNVTASKSASSIGGIVGVNLGTVSGCSFVGTITGASEVGGIVGINKEAGLVYNCSAFGSVNGTNNTGGICGQNIGTITGCVNEALVNTTELDASLDIDSEVDLGALNITKTFINRNNIGGIVGTSSGVVMLCTNNGVIGYQHTGYNVGGIAGAQSGQIYECVNNGNIFGRKDVGGIVGQAEPFVETDYLSDKLDTAKDDVNELGNTLNGISASVTNAANNTGLYVDRLVDQYSTDLDRIKGSVEEISRAVSDNGPEAQQYLDNIHEALADIEKISSSQGIYGIGGVNGRGINASNVRDLQRQIDEYEDYIEQISKNDPVSISSISVNQAAIASIQKDLQIIDSNMRILETNYTASMNSTQEAVEHFLNQVQDTGEYETVDELVNSIEQGTQSVLSAINATNNQIGSMIEKVSADIDYITNSDGIIVDISSIDTISQNGVIARSINYAKINGDINVGGVVGTMNIEYDLDPEYDIDITQNMDIALRTRVNDVVIHCMSNGQVTSKKNCAAGVVGMQEFGIVYDCEGYGKIVAEAGDYVGGVVGNSQGAIKASYSFASLEGDDYVGGIAGRGSSIADCIALADIEPAGECYGGVAGNITGDGAVAGNYFVSDNVQGIDGISYMGVAEQRTYEEIMAFPNVPQGFNRVFVKFMIDGELVKEIELPYGASLIESDYPELVEKDGFYVAWEQDADATSLDTNVVINAVYTPWTESLAGDELNDYGNALFIVAGDFYDGTTVSMDVIRGPESLTENQTLHYAFEWNLNNARSISFNEVEAHFYAGEDTKNTKLYLLLDNKWIEKDTSIDGSYVVADIPIGASFAIVVEKKDYTVFYVGGLALIILLVLIISSVRHHRYRRLIKEREQAIREQN